MLAVVLFGNLLQNYIIENVAKEKVKEDWLFDNCNCTERNAIKCPTEINDYEDGYCVNTTKKTITNPMKACSKYNCSVNGTNETYELNQELQRWKKFE